MELDDGEFSCSSADMNSYGRSITDSPGKAHGTGKNSFGIAVDAIFTDVLHILLLSRFPGAHQ